MVKPKPKANRSRRLEVRRNKPRDAGVWAFVNSREFVWAALYVVLLTVAGGIIAVHGSDKPLLKPGVVVRQPIVTRVAFRAIDTDETNKRRIDARDMEPAVYNVNTILFSQLYDELVQIGTDLSDPRIQSLDSLKEDTREKLQLTEDSFSALREYFADPRTPAWDETVRLFIDELEGIPVLSDERARIESDQRDRSSSIRIRHPSLGELRRGDDTLLGTAKDRSALLSRVSQLLNRFPPVLRPIILNAVKNHPEPFYEFDKQETERKRQAAYDNTPQVEMTYDADSVLIHTDHKITDLDMTLIAAERDAFKATLGPVRVVLLNLGQMGLVMLIAVGVWSYVAAYNRRVFHNPMRGLVVTGLILAAQAVAVYATISQPDLILATTVLPSLLFVMILAVAYDQRFALAIGFAVSILVHASLGRPVGLLLVLLTGVGVVATLLNDVRTRSKLLSVGMWAGLSMALVVGLVGLTRQRYDPTWSVTDVLAQMFIVFVTAMIAGVTAQGGLSRVEWLFKITTSLTLKDLNDASHPLLRRLAQEAPGTYQHSLRIADMSEAAAEAIGANGLLCKVGAMYHDIGKINKPLYFVENQGGGHNRHSKLSPAMSLLIIVGHVKDGIEMAREYGLPSVLRHFIESHHGTTLVEYFYHAARRQKEAESAPAPAEFEFRYPGPKPQTKEAAILMICDGVEGAARSLDEPTPVRIEQLVHNMANKRLTDGQFDECNITLQELHLIEQSITKTLCAIYHSRIKYPTTPGQKGVVPPVEDADPDQQTQTPDAAAAS